jgi:transcriptional regulator with XRE-family HTH domain
VRRRYGKDTGRPRLSAVDFATELGVAAARYRRYERGEIQVPMAILGEIRRRTGASLDWLVCDMPPGTDESVKDGDRSTVGQRLRWARETQEPNATICAEVMRTPLATWLQYERDQLALPLEVAREFAHRFSVSLDYLYEGRLSGVAPAVEAALVEQHPFLLRRSNPPSATPASGIGSRQAPTRGAYSNSRSTAGRSRSRKEPQS